MPLDADDLLLFARVMEQGSFSRAAERLQWPKSSVSRRIAALETRLGEKLLQRSTRRLTLTEFGAGVLEHARALAAEVDAALALALHRQSRPSGRLRVSMPADVANQGLSAMLAQFVRDFPDVQLELDLSPRRVDLIAEGFDLALRVGALGQDNNSLGARLLCTLSTGLYASPAYLAAQGEPLLPEGLQDLHGLMILGRNGEPLPWTLQHAENPASSWTGSPGRRSVANAPELLLRLACAGVGITAVAELFAQAPVARGELLRVLPDWCLPATDCWAVFPERRLMPLRTRVFLDALTQALAD